MQWFMGLFTGLSSEEENSNVTIIFSFFFLLYVKKTENKLQGSNLEMISFIFII